MEDGRHNVVFADVSIEAINKVNASNEFLCSDTSSTYSYSFGDAAVDVPGVPACDAEVGPHGADGSGKESGCRDACPFPPELTLDDENDGRIGVSEIVDVVTGGSEANPPPTFIAGLGKIKVNRLTFGKMDPTTILLPSTEKVIPYKGKYRSLMTQNSQSVLPFEIFKISNIVCVAKWTFFCFQ